MKFIGFCLRHNNKSGIILIVVLWALALLSILAIGMGRGARIDLALAKHGIGKLKAEGLVWAAINYAQNLIRLDTEKEEPAADTLYQCGFYLPEGKTAEDIFKNVSLEDGSFDIRYVLKDSSDKSEICYGFQDEERRINVNAINKSNYRILVHLFLLLDLPEEQAQALAAQIVDWHDADLQKMSDSYGAEKDDYLSSAKSYGCKDAPFENIEELLLVKDVTEDIFEKIKDHVTVFPQSETDLRVNINTAPELVLKALFRFVAEGANAELSDADNLAQKIVLYRRGDDGRACTADDRLIPEVDVGLLGLNLGESGIYNTAVSMYIKRGAKYFRVWAKATDNGYGISSQVETIFDRDEAHLVYWKRK